jgi:hypothetical protein
VDIIETGVVAFVAFVFIGGSMAYFAGPPDAMTEFAPGPLEDSDVCSQGAPCPQPSEPSSEDHQVDEDEEHEEHEGEDHEDHGDKGKRRGKD